MHWTRGNSVREGIGLSDGRGLGKASSGAYLLHFSVKFGSPFVRYASALVWKTRESVRGGIGLSDGSVCLEKRAPVSGVLYVAARY